MQRRKILAFLVAIIYLFFGFYKENFAGMLVFDCFALFFIFFNEIAANFTGLVGLGARVTKIDVKSPPELVEFMGWVILFLPILTYFILSF
jgi:hypothetical protein